MKLLLIRPPQQNSSVFHILPPLGLGYLAESVKHLNVDVRIIDCVNQMMGIQPLLGLIAQAKPDIIGFTVYSHDLKNIKIISAYVKEHISRSIYILIGGPHPSVAPRHACEYLPDIDFAFKGEAEKGFAALIEYFLKKQGSQGQKVHEDLFRIPGLIYRDARGSFMINPQCYIDDLDVLGFPAWNLINPRNYFKTCHGVFYKNDAFVPIFTSRGCPQQCAFCAGHNIMGRKVRRRSVAHVVAEIKWLKSEFGIKEFHILDDNFTSDRVYVIAFCNALLDSELGIYWSCPNGVRIDSLDEEMLDVMRSSGCYALFVGIESGSQRVLDSMNKNLRLSQIKDTVVLIKRKGFKVTGFFILGYPGETEEEMRRTIQFSKSLPLDVADFSNFIPLPGSSIFRQLFGEDGLCRINFSSFSSPANIIGYSENPQDARRRISMIRKAYLEFYARPRILADLMLRIRSPYQFYYILKRLVAYLSPRSFLLQKSLHA